MIEKDKSNLIILDGDFLPFTATMGNKVFDLETNEPLKEEGRFVYTPKTLEEVYKASDDIISTILDNTKADYYIGYLGGSKSFRYNIDPNYKGNRKFLEKPPFFRECREYLKSNWGFIESTDGLEAEDSVNIVRNNFKNDFNCIVVSSDKDLTKSIEGTYLVPRNIKEVFTTSKEEAYKYFWKSMITGDKIDNITGLRGRGEVYANKVVEVAEELNTLLEVEVFDRYIRYYDHNIDKAIEEFYKNYKCLFILNNFSSFVYPDPILWHSTRQQNRDLWDLEIEGS